MSNDYKGMGEELRLGLMQELKRRRRLYITAWQTLVDPACVGAVRRELIGKMREELVRWEEFDKDALAARIDSTYDDVAAKLSDKFASMLALSGYALRERKDLAPTRAGADYKPYTFAD